MEKIDCRHHQLTVRLECQPKCSITALGEPASRFTSAIETGNWKKVREQVLEYGWMQLKKLYKYV
jgi:hypothetical protein